MLKLLPGCDRINSEFEIEFDSGEGVNPLDEFSTSRDLQRKAFEQLMEIRESQNATLNKPQFDKFLRLVKVLEKYGELEKAPEIHIDKRFGSGGVVIEGFGFGLIGESKVKEFCNIFRECSSVTVYAKMNGEVGISCAIPDIFLYD